MALFSFNFLLFLSALLLLYYRSANPTYRRIVLTIANLAFVVSYVSLANLVPLAVFIGAGYAMVRLVGAKPHPLTIGSSIVLVVAALIVLKRYWFLEYVPLGGLLSRPIEILGVSYFSFKLIHILVDQYQGTLSAVTLGGYVNYQLGFTSFLAGPIQRYGDFRTFWEERIDVRAAQDRDAVIAWGRLMTGMFKLGMSATIAFWLFTRFEALARDGQLVGILGLFYVYPMYVYFNFAGYCDVVIAAAALMGLKQPENFNRPYLARDMVDFWNRWHMSLSSWIRDYVFMSLYKPLAARWPRAAKNFGYGALFMALLLAGIWHGAGWNFAVFGLLHGLGVVVCQVYTDVMRKRLGRAGMDRYLANRVIRVAAIVITLHYVCFTFLFFRLESLNTAQAFFLGRG